MLVVTEISYERSLDYRNHKDIRTNIPDTTLFKKECVTKSSEPNRNCVVAAAWWCCLPALALVVLPARNGVRVRVSSIIVAGKGERIVERPPVYLCRSLQDATIYCNVAVIAASCWRWSPTRRATNPWRPVLLKPTLTCCRVRRGWSNLHFTRGSWHKVNRSINVWNLRCEHEIPIENKYRKQPIFFVNFGFSKILLSFWVVGN